MRNDADCERPAFASRSIGCRLWLSFNGGEANFCSAHRYESDCESHRAAEESETSPPDGGPHEHRRPRVDVVRVLGVVG